VFIFLANGVDPDKIGSIRAVWSGSAIYIVVFCSGETGLGRVIANYAYQCSSSKKLTQDPSNGV